MDRWKDLLGAECCLETLGHLTEARSGQKSTTSRSFHFASSVPGMTSINKWVESNPGPNSMHMPLRGGVSACLPIGTVRNPLCGDRSHFQGIAPFAYGAKALRWPDIGLIVGKHADTPPCPPLKGRNDAVVSLRRDASWEAI
jgi:hypothetical protein